ncbi:MAG: class I SAM-dependent methyltransferase [Anaerolineae bacterium]
MTDDTSKQTQTTDALDPWRGLDFSGTTLVLGVGTGRQVPLLADKCRLAEGSLVVADINLERLRAVQSEQSDSVITWVQARLRQIPLCDEVVDLLVLNGLLREVPTARLAVVCDELWRVLAPGAKVRIADMLEPSEVDYHHAWTERNRIVRRLGLALEKPTALAVDITAAAKALRSTGFEDLHIAILPGYALTEAWLEETFEAIRGMAGRVADPDLRHFILRQDLERLGAAFAQGDQRAPQRFVLQAGKPGDLSVAMESAVTADDLDPPIL